MENILKALLHQEPNIRPRSLSVVGSAHSRAVALEAAEKGMILLENNCVLPLKTDTRLAVCGTYADVVNTGDHGSSRVWDKNIVTPYQGLRRVFPHTVLAGASDSVREKKETAPVPNDVAIRADADAAVVCVGFDYKAEGEYFTKVDYSLEEKPHNGGGDRLSLRLSAEEVALIKGLKNAGKKVIVCLFSGSAVLIDEWKDYADAVIMHYYGGCEGGTALANLLSGKTNFSGKLPFTVARCEEDYPPFKFIGEKPYVIEYGYYHGYTKMDKEGKTAAYPFGYGLSYTSFALGEPEVAVKGNAVTVTVQVTNTGSAAGAEAVQVYAGSDGAANGADRPVKLLKGIKRVEAAPGEAVTAEITIPTEELRFYENGQWVLDDAYTLYIGTDSRNAALCARKVQF